MIPVIFSDHPVVFICCTGAGAHTVAKTATWGPRWKWRAWNWVVFFQQITLQGTNISPTKALLKIIFLFRSWDMLIPWRVPIFRYSKSCPKQIEIVLRVYYWTLFWIYISIERCANCKRGWLRFFGSLHQTLNIWIHSDVVFNQTCVCKTQVSLQSEKQSWYLH